MLYLRNTNQLQSIGEVVRRGATVPVVNTDATIDYLFAENSADGRLIILDDGNTILDLTSSASSILTVASSSVVSASLSGISWPLTGSTSMSLFITGANVSYNQTSIVSSSTLMTNWTALSGAAYIVSASINHNPNVTPIPPSPGTGRYAYGFAKGGSVGSTFEYVDQNNVSQSFSLGAYLTSSVDSPFIFDTTIGISTPVGPIAAQTWSSPFTSSFTTGSSSSCKTTTFTNPRPSSPASENFYLAAYIPCNSTTYAFRLIKPAQSYQDCVSYLNIAYMSPGGTYNLEQSNITTGSAC
jgi:hypothetical protein